MQYIWINGNSDQGVSPDNRALAFGDGLFETMLLSGDCISHYQLHLHRLMDGCRRLDIPFSQATAESDFKLALAVVENSAHKFWRLKYIVSRGATGTGYFCDNTVVPERIMLLEPFTRDVCALQQYGVTVIPCRWQLSHQPALAGMKHLNRLDQVMARQEWSSSDIFEGLTADSEGNWIEGTMSNLFVVEKGGSVITPRLDNCGVAGVMRHVVMNTLCPKIGLLVEEKNISTFESADEIFLTNSLIGIVPVTRLADKTYKIGQITRSLQRALNTRESGL
ncbi:Aminodeoxychorismate lyase [BD1-7 clade bacterium]|uniref:Aminodeoxychorismate lyase n=1 Tax=BD1-7 clade bacterium TaxID=2029982 RepID=A0A5S9QCM4_9GAMM|nr:Aminodeoxychorismate lyase [BD1-7 clade bacterium]CAA0116031.1 Aminodeoxychorismate lyase [BD1-7 clade bacterium]CAA0119697.1 Aminodeoxychorismate lyase [BD1-7 clade bacterium]